MQISDFMAYIAIETLISAAIIKVEGMHRQPWNS